MKVVKYLSVGLALGAVTIMGLAQQQPGMSFFITSVGSGDGGNLGGLAGIGNGPWYTANGAYIAWDIDGLHEDRNNVRKPTAVDENGEVINGAGDSPNRHDILTGSDSSGRLVAGSGEVTTCSNWTSNSTGRTGVGHHDRMGGPSASWNSVHSSRSCSQADLQATGGDGVFYCFAAD